MSSLRRLIVAFCAVPLALGLAACGSDDEGSATAEPVAKVAAPAGQQWTDVAAITPEGGWLTGNPNAPIRLVEYGSPTCPACAHFSVTGMQQLRDDYVNSGRVNYELRIVPLHGTIDLVITRLLECGPKEAAHPLAEQLWANNAPILTTAQAAGAGLQDAMGLPENQRFIAFADRSGLLDFFAARGISRDQAAVCLSDAAAIRSLADRLVAQNDKDQITGTPTFFVNGSRMDDIEWAAVEAALQRAGAR